MLLRNVAICGQEYAKCRGHAADDHISRMCYTVQIGTEEQGDRLQALVYEIDRLYQIDIAERVCEWHRANPNEKECVYDGDEFIGSQWVEAGIKAYEGHCSGTTPANTMIELLEGLLAELTRTVALLQ